MEIHVLLAVLLAAVMHAGWNAVVRSDGDRFRAMLLLTITQGLMALGMAVFLPLPSGIVWLWVLASGVIHTAYKFFLSAAYQHGDLSRVYPIARGAAPMIVVLVGFFILSDKIENVELFGIGMIGLGVMLMAQGIFKSGEARSMIPFALGSAASTAAYTIVDGSGARIAGNAAVYTMWLFIFDGLIFSTYALLTRGSSVFVNSKRSWAIGAIAGGMSLGTYWIAIWAMTVAPIALVAAVRETSVLFAVLLGVFIMKEKASWGKAVAAVVIVAGVVVIRL